MAEAGGLLHAVQTFRDAANGWNGTEGPRQFNDSRLTAGTIIGLVATGGDAIGALDLPGAAPAVQSRRAA